MVDLLLRTPSVRLSSRVYLLQDNLEIQKERKKKVVTRVTVTLVSPTPSRPRVMSINLATFPNTLDLGDL